MLLEFDTRGQKITFYIQQKSQAVPGQIHQIITDSKEFYMAAEPHRL